MSNETVPDAQKPETQEDRSSLVELFDERLSKLEDMIMKDRLNRLELDYNNAMNCRNRGFVCSKFNDDEEESSESSESEEEDNTDKLSEAIKKLEEQKKEEDRKSEPAPKSTNAKQRAFKITSTKTEAIKANVKNRVGNKAKKVPPKIKSVTV